ncbi:hypothetical protein [Glaciihabitans sp. GrIS 2.15]|uniref:hypothetical protein n=1 Tax=Glaciihabitans sp. GrIS 2.15 TaxID=3071710 RepID=UPI002DF86790|nr:hypothetical protein [Glaciihabitans sp. GrIS 2.15]
MTDSQSAGAAEGFADEGETQTGVDLPADLTANQQAPATRWTIGDRIAGALRVLTGREVGRRISEDPDVQIRRGRARQENRWRNIYAFVLLVGMGVQVWFADMYMMRYSEAKNFDVDPSVIIAFLSSVVVEVIGLVLVITQSLFPRSGNDSPRPRD